MATDGGLRQIFRKHLPDFHWQGVETGSTGRGIPDDNYCCRSVEGWVEGKATSGNKIDMRPEQVGWIERRRRAGGRVFIAVRRQTQTGPRRGPATDGLYLFPGEEARALADNGLLGSKPILVCAGGPASWPWDQIRSCLLDFDFLFLPGSGKEKDGHPAHHQKDTTVCRSS